MKYIIAGSRNIVDKKFVFQFLDKYKDEIDVVISGCARGVDELGIRWASLNDKIFKFFPANWVKFGKSAGYLRNYKMAEVADGLIAFWDGESKGTKHMIDTMNKLKKKVIVVNYEHH